MILSNELLTTLSSPSRSCCMNPSFSSSPSSLITCENHVIHSFRSFISIALMRRTSSMFSALSHSLLVLFLSASRILSTRVFELLIFETARLLTDTTAYSKSTTYFPNIPSCPIISRNLRAAVQFHSPLYRIIGMIMGSL